jgi:lipopolysaccharide export system protein LptC
MSATVSDRIFRLTAWSPLLFLAALSALTYWLSSQVQSNFAFDKNPPHVADLYLKNFDATVLDKTGQPSEWLSAGFAEHFSDDNSFALKNLKWILKRPNEPLLTVTADQGTATGDRKNIYLHKNVVAVRQGCKEAGLTCSATPMTLNTDYLYIKPKEKIMTSDQKVVMTSPDGRIESMGIYVDDKTHTMRLESNVSGTFNSLQKHSKHE